MSDIEKLKRKVFQTRTCRRFRVLLGAMEELCTDLEYADSYEDYEVEAESYEELESYMVEEDDALKFT